MSAAPSSGLLATPPAAVAADFELMLFGAPRVLHRGALLHFGSRKALTILAMLALDGSTTRERLAALLWPEADASAARRNLRRDLFRLRDLQLPLLEQADGHLALAEGWRIDVLAFRRALAAGDEAAALSMSAPTLFDGLDGVAGDEIDRWLSEQRAEPLRLRQQAQRSLAQARAEQGDTDTALALWTQSLEEDPCHEAALLPAMALLSQRGERAAALALFERTRQALQQRLDAEPAMAAQSLAVSLRQREGGDAPGATALSLSAGRGRPADSLDAAAPADSEWKAALAARSPFVGRSALLAQVQQAWATGQRVVLSGVSGVGKTRLAGAWLRLSCRPLDAAEPFCSAVNALRALMHAAPGLVLPAWVRRELAQLMPEFGAAPEHTPNAAQGQRLREAFGEALRLLTGENFDAVVLDDWQWCDADSRALLELLGRSGELRCIVTYRSGELSPAALQALQLEIDNGSTLQVDVPGLAPDETLALVQALAPPSSAQALAARLHEATQGHPLHVLETLRHLGERPRHRAAGELLPLPPSVRDTVLARVRAQGESSRRLLEAASLLGGDFEPGWLEGLVEGGPGIVVEGLERAEAARLLDAHGTRYRFSHDLLRQCVAESLSPARRQWLHQRLAERLVEAEALPALVAIQYEQAGQHRQAVPWRLRAGAEAAQRHALAEATRHYGCALADRPDAADAVTAHLALHEVHVRAGDRRAAADAVAAAVAVAAGADAATRVQAQLACAEHWTTIERGADALALVASMAGDLAGADAVAQARALACVGAVHSRAGRYREAGEHQRQAIALLEQAPGGLQRLGRLLHAHTVNALYSADPVAAETIARRERAAFEVAGDQGGIAEALGLLAVARIHQGDGGPDTVALLQQAREIAMRCGNVPAQRMALANLVKLADDRGDFDAMQTLLDEAFELAPGFEAPAAEFNFLLYRFHLHWGRGELALCDAAIAQALTIARGLDDLRLRVLALQIQTELCLDSGRLEQADALLQQAERALANTDGAEFMSEPPRLRAKWLLKAGQPHAAEAVWAGIPAARLNPEDGFTVAITGSAIALALGDVALARKRLEAAPVSDGVPPRVQATVLAQQLAVARTAGESTAELQAQAQALLAAGVLHVPTAQELQAALQRLTHGVATPR